MRRDLSIPYCGLERRGYIRSMPKQVDIDREILFRMYVTERKSLPVIAKEIGRSASLVYSNLRRHGIPSRGHAEAARIIVHNTPPDVILARSKPGRDAAVLATKGVRRSFENRVKIAAALARRQPTALEQVFIDALRWVGLRPKPQFQVENYVLDIAFPAAMLAVEIDPSHWHRNTRSKHDRIRDARLAELGWTVYRWSGERVRSRNKCIADDARIAAALFVSAESDRLNAPPTASPNSPDPSI